MTPVVDHGLVAERGRFLALAAMVGVVVYVSVDVVLQFLPPYYSPISEAESNLAVGPFGWIMNLNFLGRAVTSFAAAGALLSVARAAGRGRSARRSLSSLLVTGLTLFTLGGLCSAVLAFFPADVLPPERRAPGRTVIAETTVGSVHLGVATLGFIAALLAIVLLTAWAYRSGCLPAVRRGALAFTVLAAVGLMFLALTVTVLPSLIGLAERTCLVGILGWTYWVARGIRRLR
jgi:MFS family permease